MCGCAAAAIIVVHLVIVVRTSSVCKFNTFGKKIRENLLYDERHKVNEFYVFFSERTFKIALNQTRCETIKY